MANQLQSKQIKKVTGSYIRIPTVASGTGSSVNITSVLQTELSSLGISTTIVAATYTAQATSTQGVIVAPPYNMVSIHDATTKKRIKLGIKKVFGRVTLASNVATLSFYTYDNSGVEQAYTFG